MKENRQPVKSFKANLKRTLLAYSLIPVFEVMLVCTALVLAVGGIGIARKNKNTNGEIAGELQQVLSSYDSLLSELAAIPGIVDPMTSLTKRQKLIRRLYTTSVETGYEADLYIVDPDANVCVSTNEEVAGNLRTGSARKWGILTELDNRPEGRAAYVNAVGSDRRIYLGRNVTEDSKKTGSVILSLPYREFTRLLSGYSQKNILVDDSGWVFAASSYTFVDAVGRLAYPAAGKTSLKLSACCALIAGSCGVIIGYAVVRRRGTRLSKWVSGLSFFPYLIPAMAFGAIYLAIASNFSFLANSFLILVLVGSVKYLPFATKSGTNAMLQLSAEIEEAATIFGISWWKRMTKIIIPIQKASIISGFLLPFVSCMRELSLFVMLVSSKTQTLTTMLMTYNEKGASQYGNAINLLIIVLVLSINFAVNKLTGASIDKGVGGN